MTSEGRVCLGLVDVKRYGAPYFGRSDAESVSTEHQMKGYVAEPKVTDWQMNAWYCMSSVRYGRWPVLRILWTKQASLNRIHHLKMCWLFSTVDWIVLSLLAMWTPLSLPYCIVCWQRACRRRRLRSPRKCRVKLWNDCCGVLRIRLRDWNTASSSTTPRCFVLSRSSTSC